MNRRLGLVALVFACATSVVGCSDDKVDQAGPGEADAATADASEKASEEEPDGPSEEDLTAYFEGVASYDVDKLKAAVELAAPDSLAYHYASYLLAFTTAMTDGGETSTASKVTRKEDGVYENCPDSADAECFLLDNIKAEGGKIASFDTGGKPIKGRILVGNGKPTRIGDMGTAELLYAFQGSKSLFVVLEMKSARHGVSINYETSYRTKQGRQIQHSGVSGPATLQPNSLANYALAFPRANLGGELFLDLYAETGTATGNATIPIR